MEIWKIILIVGIVAVVIGFLLWVYLVWAYRQKAKALVRFGARAVPIIVHMSYGTRMILYYTLFRQRGYISKENFDALLSCGIPFNFGRAREGHFGFESDVSFSNLLKVGNEDEIDVLKDAFLIAHGWKDNILGYEWKWEEKGCRPTEDTKAIGAQIKQDIKLHLVSIKFNEITDTSKEHIDGR